MRFRNDAFFSLPHYFFTSFFLSFQIPAVFPPLTKGKIIPIQTKVLT
jgi:hypothetical protein